MEHYENDLIELLEAYDHNREVHFQLDIYDIFDMLEEDNMQDKCSYGLVQQCSK